MTEQDDRKYPEAGLKMKEFYENAAKKAISQTLCTAKLPALIEALETVTETYTLRVEAGLVVISFKYPAQQHACACGGSCKEGKL